jgi:outer membrane protein, heavy metal efflux system
MTPAARWTAGATIASPAGAGRRRRRPGGNLAWVLAVAGCTALEIPPEETPYFREQMALSRAAPRAAKPGDEAAVLRDAAAKLDLRAAAEAERIRRGDETEGLLDTSGADAKAFLAKLADPATAEATFAATTLDLDHVLLAVYARNRDVAAARAEWAATVRMYDQATYLEDLLLRYSAFTRLATPRVGAAPMREAAFPYPGLVAMKGEMIDREVAMAREMTRMRLRDAIAAASNAFHTVTHHAEELRIREEQLALADRVLAATRAMAETGRRPQSELLEMETERSMAANDREHAVTSLARARGELNALLDRDPGAPLVLAQHEHAAPPDAASPVEPLLALARRWSPEVRIARAEVERSAAAIRMAEAMLFAAPAPGAVAQGAPMGGAMPVRETEAAAAAPSGGMGAMGAAGAPRAAAPQAPALPPRDEPASGAPGAFGPDVAWIAQMKERHAALVSAAEEAVRKAERRVLDAHYELEAQRRMFAVAAKTAEPLAAQAAEERLRLYEAGRADFADLATALRRRLDAAHDAIAARHDYWMAEAMIWMAIGARPEVVGAGEGDQR